MSLSDYQILVKELEGNRKEVIEPNDFKETMIQWFQNDPPVVHDIISRLNNKLLDSNWDQEFHFLSYVLGLEIFKVNELKESAAYK